MSDMPEQIVIYGAPDRPTLAPWEEEGTSMGTVYDRSDISQAMIDAAREEGRREGRVERESKLLTRAQREVVREEILRLIDPLGTSERAKIIRSVAFAVSLPTIDEVLADLALD